MERRGHHLDSILAENDNIFFKYRICKKLRFTLQIKF
jgi:hypothetical protein